VAQASDEVSGSEALAAGCDAADVSPGSTVICRPVDATGSGYENVTD